MLQHEPMVRLDRLHLQVLGIRARAVLRDYRRHDRIVRACQEERGLGNIVGAFRDTYVTVPWSANGLRKRWKVQRARKGEI